MHSRYAGYRKGWDTGTPEGAGISTGGHQALHRSEPRSGPDGPVAATADVGVLTVLDQEIRAVTAALRHMYDYGQRRLVDGQPAHEAWLPSYDGARVRVAAVQAPEPGTDSAALTYHRLVEEYNPSTVLLVGIAAGLDPGVRAGDVVVSDQVIDHHTHRAVAAALGHRLNDFFAVTPVTQHRPSGISFRVHRGPIGSVHPAMTDAGVVQSFHESVRHDRATRGWLTVQGVSDTPDRTAGDDHQHLAAQHAAEVMAMLVPFLHFGEG